MPEETETRPGSQDSYLESDGLRIAYCRLGDRDRGGFHRPVASGAPGAGPGVMFLGGFRSAMTGAKALAVEAHCRARGRGCVRFDYRGHGASAGAFVDGTIGAWTRDALAVFDRLTTGPTLLVGSSMGAWIAVQVALARPERVAGLVGIASAPDFTRDRIEARLDDAARRALATSGVVIAPSAHDPAGYPITRALIEDGRHHLVLDHRIPLAGPVRLIHGMADSDVPWQTSLRLAEAIETPDVGLTLIKDGDHRLSRDRDIARILGLIDELSQP